MDLSLNRVYIDEMVYDEVTLAACVRYTQEFLAVGQRVPVLVQKQDNGLYKVIANHTAYLVAHILGYPTVKVQEYVERKTPVKAVAFPQM